MAKAKAPRKPRAAKARVEGEAVEPAALVAEEPVADCEHDHGVEVVEVPFEEPSGFESLTVEQIEAAGRLPNPVPGDDGDALDRIVASFKARFPEKWEGLALCPLQHGVVAMADEMRGKG